MEDTTIKLIAKLYEEGLPPSKIKEVVGFSETKIYKALRLGKVKMRTIAEAKKKLKIDVSFFEKIDSHIKAQILGFIYADGCIPSSRYRIQIIIAEQDREYLEFIKRETKFEGTIKTYISKKKNEQNTCRLSLGGKKITEDIIRLGCGPRKSQTLTFPTPEQVPEEFLSSFMLGYLEGDGCICGAKGKPKLVFAISICGTKSFLQDYAVVLNKNLGTHCVITEYPGMWQIRIGGNRQVEKVLNWLYAKVNYSLSRKRKKYEDLIEINKNTKTYKNKERINEPYSIVETGQYMDWYKRKENKLTLPSVSPTEAEGPVTVQ